MTKISRDDVLKLARLSRFRLTEEEINQFTSEITVILQYVEQLQGIDLDDLEPTYQVTGLTNVMRKDTVVEYQATPEDLLKNVSAVESDHIKVHRMLDR